MKNWAGNLEYTAETISEPGTIAEVVASVSSVGSLRALGSRHSFNDIADSTVIVDTRGFGEHLELNVDRTAITVNASMTYGRLAELLRPLGFGLANMASLPHISIAGAISTGTHGSGLGNGNLATSVAALEIATSSGEVGRIGRGDDGFSGAVVGLGALGVITKVTLDIEPAYQVSQLVYEDLEADVFTSNLDEIMGLAYSVSGFTTWGGLIEQIWVKQKVGEVDDEPHGVFGALPAPQDRHPIRELSAESCTAQMGDVGLWSDRLPHFRLDFTPSAGEEIQSEFFVDWSNAGDAVKAIQAIGPRLSDALLISELRAIKSDDLWMSPHYQRQSLALHFTWKPDVSAAAAAAELVGDVLAEFDARAHWGKVFTPRHANLASYDRLADFEALRERFDPRGAFENDWFRRVFAATR